METQQADGGDARRAHERSPLHRATTGRRSTSRGGTWTRASWRDRGRGRPPCWWSISAGWWRRASIRCGFSRSRLPRRPPAICARSWRAAFDDEPRIRAALERAWVSTVHGFCARLLRENAVFAGVDPEFRVADERESWRMQQEAMAAAMESLFREQPEEVRALIRGLSSIDFEEAVLSAYDAMRGAGMRRRGTGGISRRPPGGGLGASRGRRSRRCGGSRCGCGARRSASSARARSKAAERILSARRRARGAGRHRGVSRAICQKCKRGNAAYELLKQLKAQVDEARVRADHRATTRRSGRCCSRSCGGSTRSYRDAQAAGRRARLLRSGGVHGAAAGGAVRKRGRGCRRSSTTS